MHGRGVAARLEVEVGGVRRDPVEDERDDVAEGRGGVERFEGEALVAGTLDVEFAEPRQDVPAVRTRDFRLS
jgi:hypothetical protein